MRAHTHNAQASPSTSRIYSFGWITNIDPNQFIEITLYRIAHFIGAVIYVLFVLQ